jgi:hypothetical protein
VAEIIPFPEDRARARRLAEYPDHLIIRKNTDDPPTVPDNLTFVRECELDTPAYKGQRVWYWVCADCDIETDPEDDFEENVRQANDHWHQVHDGQP